MSSKYAANSSKLVMVVGKTLLLADAQLLITFRLVSVRNASIYASPTEFNKGNNGLISSRETEKHVVTT